MKKAISLISLICIFLTCADNLGTNDETIIKTGAIIYEPDGKTPSVGATVKVFSVNTTDGQYAIKSSTDANGRYSLKGLSKGTYNIWAEKDSFVVFQDSVFVSDDQSTLKSDTLHCPSTLTGIVGVQPQHDPRTVTIQVVGTDKYFNNIDSDGRFIMKGMAGGSYTLLLKSTLPEYTPTTSEIIVRTCSDDTLKDTLWLIYTGIPVVTGVTASYDTVKGTVQLNWNKTGYRSFQEYAIYRDFYDSINLSMNPVAVVTDTVFVDSVFRRSIPTGPFSMVDPKDYHFKYRIAIRNNSWKFGETYKYTSVVAASPTKVKNTFAFTTYHLSLGVFTDSASINDSIRFAVQLANPTRMLKSVAWIDLSSGITIRSKKLDSALKSAADTCIYVWNTTGTKALECSVVDMAGTKWSDTVKIQIATDAPFVQLTTPTQAVEVMDSIKLHLVATDKFGRIDKIEWDIGNRGVYTTGMAMDTVVVAPNFAIPYVCIVRVTDDDGFVSLDTNILQIIGKVTDADGNVYHLVKIGNQEWTVENLRVTKYNDGTAIPLVTDQNTWISQKTPGYCYYNNMTNADSIKKYGALYNWYVVNTKKLAPIGWHVPSRAEWDTLQNYLIANGYNWDLTIAGNKIAKSLSAKTDWQSSSTTGAIGCDLTQNNRSGFSALPGGCRVDYGEFYDQSSYGHWWSATEINASIASYCTLGKNFVGLTWGGSLSMGCGHSVRLLRDN